MIKPLSKFVVLQKTAVETAMSGLIHIPESARADHWEYRVVSCGSKVPAEIQPGARVIIDPTSLAQREFEHEGKTYKLVPWEELKMLLGVDAE